MQRILIGILRAYKQWVSPWLPSACRFQPTCSVYAREAIEVHGARRGMWLAMKRLVRCHPFHPGGFDPVPPAEPDSHHGQAEPREFRVSRPSEIR